MRTPGCPVKSVPPTVGCTLGTLIIITAKQKSAVALVALQPLWCSAGSHAAPQCSEVHPDKPLCAHNIQMLMAGLPSSHYQAALLAQNSPCCGHEYWQSQGQKPRS